MATWTPAHSTRWSCAARPSELPMPVSPSPARSPSRRGGTGGEACGGASSGAEGGAASSEDELLFIYAARGRAPGADPSPSPARSSPSPAASDDSHDSTASAGSDSDSDSDRDSDSDNDSDNDNDRDASPPRAGAGRGSTAGGRACDRDGVAARGRGGRGSRGGRSSRGCGRGRGRSAAPLTTELGEHIVEDTDSEVEEEAEADADKPVREEGGDILQIGAQVWKKIHGRSIDPFLTNGRQQVVAFKLHGHTEKPVLDYFSACFPAGLVEDIAASMTRCGSELCYGASWEVTSGEFWRFLAYNMAVLIIHSGGPKENLWLKPGYENHGAFFTAPDPGQYGLQYSTFRRMMRAFTLPTYGDNTDPFDPVRQFVDCWNARMVSMLSPGPLITVDESMGLWTCKRNKAVVAAGGDGMPGWIFVGRKPTNRGRESHTTADCETGCIVFVEPYEGAVRMASKEFIPEWGKNPAKCIRGVKPWFGSGRCVIADSGFASVKCTQGLAEHGLFMIGNVKTGSAGFPKLFLLSNLKERGDRVCLTSSIKTSSGQEWSLLAAGDRDKQPMSLLGTAGTSNMGDAMQRAYGVLKADGSFEVRKLILEQWDIHSTYRRKQLPMLWICTTQSAKAQPALRILENTPLVGA
eukprot:jgi/Tetstr1/430159/TSEL_019991.t1